jgi:predicted phosphodiesterase
MRLLAFSDIHHNLVAVRKLRAAEKNSFDAIIVAGDIGSKSATEFFKILATFKCPVMYVYGNWDNELGYKTCFGRQAQLIQSNVITIGKISFTGFSGCPTHWGSNPMARKVYREVRQAHQAISDAHSRAEALFWKQAKTVGLENARKPLRKITSTKAYQKYAAQLQSARSEILRLNRESIGKAVNWERIDPRRCVIITHQRLTRLSEELPGALLHLFGHIHQFSDRTFKETKYINVAALDRPISARPCAKEKWGREDFRNFNAGNYVTIEINSSLEIKAKCVALPHEYPNWIPLDDRTFHGIEWIPEEAEWTNPADQPLIRYERRQNPKIVESL